MTYPFTTPRGMSHAEAMAYVGVKRRTFDEKWRPRLVPMRQGTTTLYDREDLDRLFNDFKAEAMKVTNAEEAAANDAGPVLHNCRRNGRPMPSKGEHSWAKKLGASTPKKTVSGRLTNGGAALDFASAVSEVMKRRKDG